MRFLQDILQVVRKDETENTDTICMYLMS